MEKYNIELLTNIINKVSNISQRLTVSTGLLQCLEIINQEFSEIEEFNKSLVFLKNHNDSSFQLIYSHNTDHKINSDLQTITPLNNLYNKINTNKALIVQSKEVFPSNNNSEDLIIIPSIINNEVLALIIIFANVPNEIKPACLQLLDIIYTKVAAIIGRIDVEDLIREHQFNIENLFSTIDEMIFIINEEGKILNYNNAVYRQLGYTDDELNNINISDIRPIQYREESKIEINKAFTNELKISLLPYQNVLSKNVSAETSFSKGMWNNKPIMILLVRNVIEREQAENELWELKRKAEEANKAKTLFLKKISHEFRIPLNSIMGMSELLIKTNLDQKQFNYLNVILSSTENLHEILNDMLDISNINSNNIVLKNNPFRLKNVLQKVIDNNFYSINNKEIEFISDFARFGNNHFINGDSERIYQILSNITKFCISNTSKERIKINIIEKNISDKNITYNFNIKNYGKALSTEEINRIILYSDNNSDDYIGKPGIGLLIANKLIECHNSKLYINSNDGNIFSFDISFPISTNNEINKIVDEKNHVENFNNAEKINILLAEDQVFNQLIIKEMCDEWGFNLDIVDNGKMVINNLSENKFYDIILLDIQMPIMNGIDTTRIIRNTFPKPVSDIPIIALTAYAYADEQKIFMDLGINDSITKPFKSQMLFHKIANLIGVSKSQINNELSNNEFVFSKLNENLYDLSSIRQITRNNSISFNNMINVFIDKSAEELNDIKEHLKNNDWVNISKVAHKMKPALSYMGMKQLEDIVNELHRICITEKAPKTDVPNLIISLEQLYKNVINELRKEII